MSTIHIPLRKYKRSKLLGISFSWGRSGLHPVRLVSCDLTHPVYKVEGVGSCAWESPELSYAAVNPAVTYCKFF